MSDSPAITDGPRPTRPWRALDVALLLLVLAITTWVRATHLDPAPSFDELWHMACTTGHGSPLSGYAYDVVIAQPRRQVALDDARPIWTLWRDQRDVIHPPLFEIALRVWRATIGEGDGAAHAFSITWGVVALTFLFATARLAISAGVAAAVTLALGCAQAQVYLAQEIRPYAMLNAIGAIAVWQMTRIESLGATRRRAIALGLTTLPLVLTHYFGFGGAVAIGAYGVFRAAPHRRAFLIAVAGAAVFFIVTWMPFALRQTRDLGIGGGPLPSHLVAEAMMALAAPFRVFADRAYTTDPLSVVAGVLFVLPWMMIRRFRPLLPWAIWLTATVGCLVALDVARSSFHVRMIRYLSVATPAVPLLFVGCAWPIRRGLAYVVALGIFGVGVTYLISRGDVIAETPDYHDVAKPIAARIRPGDAVLFADASGIRRSPIWLMVLGHEPGVFPRPVAMLTRPMSPAMLADLGTTRVWLVAEEGRDPTTLVPGSRVVESFHTWEAIQICKLELSAPTTLP